MMLLLQYNSTVYNIWTKIILETWTKSVNFSSCMHNDTDTSILDEIASQQEKEWVGDGGQRKCNKESIQQFLCGML